jgi:hypothetical protein
VSYARAVELIEYWAEPAEGGGKPMTVDEFASTFGGASGG